MRHVTAIPTTTAALR